MPTTLVTIEAVHNSRVQAGICNVEHLWTLEEGYAVYPHGLNNFIQTTLEIDLGRYDSEGDSYICELISCLPADIYTTYLED
jgi:hypothetical protein